MISADNSDFIAKLRQIEELAAVAHEDLPKSLLMLRTRVQHIVVLAKTLRGRLELGSVAVVRTDPEATVPGEPEKPPV
jgi:hypothetical protein